MATEHAFEVNGDTIIRLTEREIEVLKLVLEGKSNKEVAALLCCSKRTVDFHLARIYQKLDVSNRVQAMRRVAHMGIFSLDSSEELQGGGNGHK
jgi:DNA-binding CsgD family transcriptional regulator